MTSEFEPDAPMMISRIEIIHSLLPDGTPDFGIEWDNGTDEPNSSMVEYFGMLVLAGFTIYNACTGRDGVDE